MNDPTLRDALTWGITNSDGTRKDPNAPQPKFTQEMVDKLCQPTSAKPLSSAELMQYNMAAIKSPEITLKDKLIAFDNFLQLMEMGYEANNLDPLGLWAPLAEELSSPEPEVREAAAWCISTAVQNNDKTQEEAHSLGLVPTLADMALNDSSKEVRKMAISALSSSIRNCQPGLDTAWQTLPDEHKLAEKPGVSDMEQITKVMDSLRRSAGVFQPEIPS